MPWDGFCSRRASRALRSSIGSRRKSSNEWRRAASCAFSLPQDRKAATNCWRPDKRYGDQGRARETASPASGSRSASGGTGASPILMCKALVRSTTALASATREASTMTWRIRSLPVPDAGTSRDGAARRQSASHAGWGFLELIHRHPPSRRGSLSAMRGCVGVFGNEEFVAALVDRLAAPEPDHTSGLARFFAGPVECFWRDFWWTRARA